MCAFFFVSSRGRLKAVLRARVRESARILRAENSLQLIVWAGARVLRVEKSLQVFERGLNGR